MNDQNQTTSTPSEPTLCKMGCGFFGSNATGDCCSRCYNEKNKKAGAAAAASPAAALTRPQPSASLAPAPVFAPVTSPVADFDEPAAIVAVETKPAAVPSPAKKLKKKKKLNYRNMISGMMEGSVRDAEKEKESIQKVTGGGTFVKVDKI